MKLGFSPAFSIRAFVRIMKLLSTNPPNRYGKIISSNSSSIVMEYADYGDLFQKITKHQKDQTYFKEDEVWSIFI
jgi:serine/threonine protein kinase